MPPTNGRSLRCTRLPRRAARSCARSYWLTVQTPPSGTRRASRRWTWSRSVSAHLKGQSTEMLTVVSLDGFLFSFFSGLLHFLSSLSSSFYSLLPPLFLLLLLFLLHLRPPLFYSSSPPHCFIILLFFPLSFSSFFILPSCYVFLLLLQADDVRALLTAAMPPSALPGCYKPQVISVEASAAPPVAVVPPFLSSSSSGPDATTAATTSSNAAAVSDSSNSSPPPSSSSSSAFPETSALPSLAEASLSAEKKEEGEEERKSLQT